MAAVGGMLPAAADAQPVVSASGLRVPPPRDSLRRDSLPRPRGQRFYTRLPYGSESQFNPISELFNEGFNDLVLYSTDMKLFGQPYGASWNNLMGNLRNVRGVVRFYGWNRVMRNELLPLTGARDGGQWLLNYTDHMLGNGMVSVRLEEWYAQHGYPAPLALSVLTMYGAHLLNEVVERPGRTSVDPLADLLVFDPLGMLLFRLDRVQRAFSGPVRMTVWSGQPVLTMPTGAIENAFTEFVTSVPVPLTKQWRAFVMTGVNVMGGLRRDVGNGAGYSLAAGAGADVVRSSDSTTDARTVKLGPRAGIYYDRNGSLLWSVLYNRSRDGLLVVNLYPGVVKLRGFSPGFWFDIRPAGLRFAVVAPFGLGTGFGKGSPGLAPPIKSAAR